MKRHLLLLSLFFVAAVTAQDVNEDRFRRDLTLLVKDAATGFKLTKGDYKETILQGRQYAAAQQIFDKTGKSTVQYYGEFYNKYERKTYPPEYYFSQAFDLNTPEGAFVKTDGERIIDDLAVGFGLSKEIVKLKKSDRDRKRRIEYLDKNGRAIVKFTEYFLDLSIQIDIHSDLKPDDLPNYLGCLVLYCTQADKVVSAFAMYVYGENIVDEAQLYSKAISKFRNGGGACFTKYSYYPAARSRDIEARLDALAIPYNMSDITPEGNIFDGRVQVAKQEQYAASNASAAKGCLQGDCYNGFGIVQYDSGNRFEGFFKNGRIGESGKFIYMNGDYYEGKFVDELNTDGKFFYAADNVTYTGTFYPDGRQRSGTYHFAVNNTKVHVVDGEITSVDNPEAKRLASQEAERSKGRLCDKCGGKGMFPSESYAETTEHYYSVNFVTSSGNLARTNSGNVGKTTKIVSTLPTKCTHCKGTGKIYDTGGVIINSGKY